MTLALSLSCRDDYPAISPFLEMGAYEALWDKNSASFKALADMFRKNEGAVPSDFVPEGEAREYAKRVVEMFRKGGIEDFGVRVHGAGEYPMKLREARHPIELLYFRGWWDLVETRSVAVVGTREPTEEGVRRTRKLAHALVKDGITVVSGLAKGVDGVAHTTAIEAGGRTIAVVGTPLNHCYPKQHHDLQKLIASEFLLISQVPVCRYARQGPRGNRLFFPERNVTMSALTMGTIIVEAGETSGTLTQARAALHQGRKLFILDSCFRNPEITWPAKFAKQGAIRVKDYDDIRKHLAIQTHQD